MKDFLLRIVVNFGLVVVSLGLLFGGIILLRTEVPFWNLFYGLPAVCLGIILTVLSFNELTKNKNAKSTEYHLIPCKVCRKETLVPMLINETVCSSCQYKMAIRLNIGVLLFFVLLAIPVTYHLSQKQQDLRQNAQVPLPTPVCLTGSWDPQTCSCGTWTDAFICSGKALWSRVCNDINYCCIENEPNSYTCTQHE